MRLCFPAVLSRKNGLHGDRLARLLALVVTHGHDSRSLGRDNSDVARLMPVAAPVTPVTRSSGLFIAMFGLNHR